jgi:hypothetical protein
VEKSEREKKLTRTNARLVQSTTATSSLKLRAINMQISYEQALRPILALKVFKMNFFLISKLQLYGNISKSELYSV